MLSLWKLEIVKKWGMSQEHLKLISGYKIPQRTLGSILDILGLEIPWSRTTCSLGIHGYGHGNSILILFQFSVQVNWSLLILPLPKKLPMVDLNIFLIKVLIKTFSFFQQDSSELTGKKTRKKTSVWWPCLYFQSRASKGEISD